MSSTAIPQQLNRSQEAKSVLRVVMNYVIVGTLSPEERFAQHFKKEKS